jgi:hypothetical protein
MSDVMIFRVSTVPGIGVSRFLSIDDALGMAKTLLEEDSTVSIKIMKEEGEYHREQRSETRSATSDAEGDELAGSTAATTETTDR